jgi:phospho-N-acetylmuramoyl-pentapeptide-transferase
MRELGWAAFLFICAFAVSLAVGPSIIAWLRRAKAGQVVQSEGPQSHASKAGTPAMGGIIILIGFLVPVAGLRAIIARYGGMKFTLFEAVVSLILVYAVLGIADDWLTIRPRNGRRGIGSKPKFLLQLVAAAGFVAYLALTGEMSTTVALGRGVHIDLGWAYAPLAVLFITGMANFVNITDGLDGLAAGLAAILATALFFAVETKAIVYPWMFPALAGACLGFLWYNFNPAKVFMGDTGSLAIGVAIPAIAIVTKTEVVMIIAGMVFILDGFSSALQWAVFKYTRIRTGTGRRIFKMSPVHHHFELSGWPEQNVVIKFWITGVLFAALALAYWNLA